ncbi:MAG: phage holin family protein [Proteiniphilum sp.]|uniref:phage holin family protein n=1 Tax=Proteiniphilum sp. TaxID=1926877 RepID=UPI002ABB664A|nr:phage holin family protein [Proteiniphilum sp.]MDY9918739.1 phage holin family protein [Proteiniphilum sp.]
MEEKKVSTLFEEMRDDISNYISSSLELGKLEVYEKLSLGSAAISYGLIIAGIALVALLFALVTVALYLGELLGSLWAGFGIVSGFSILVLLIMLLLKKYFNQKVTNGVIRFLMTQDDKDDKKSDK